MKRENAISLLAHLHANFDYSCSFQLSSENILKYWNYKVEGLKVKGAIVLILADLERQKTLRSKRYGTKGKDILFYAKGRRETKLRIMRENRQQFRITMDKAVKVERWSWGNNIVFINETTFAQVHESVSYDNKFYAKSYGFGKKTVDARFVRFSEFDSKKGELKQNDIMVDSFRGKFLQKAIDKYLVK